MFPSKNACNLFKQMVSSSRSSYAFAVCLAAIILAYRIQLTIGLFTNSIRPFDFNPGSRQVGFMLTYLPYDLALVLAGFSITRLFSQPSLFIKNSKALFILRIFGFISLHLAIFTILVIHGAHLQLLFGAQTGLDTSMIMETWKNIQFTELSRFIKFKEVLFLFLPVGLFWLVLFLPLPVRRWMAGISIILIILFSSFLVFAAKDESKNVPREIRLNPAFFLLSDVLNHASFGQTSDHENIYQHKRDESGLQLTGLAYIHPINPLKWLPPKSKRPWNVIFFVMESVGTRYAFDTSQGPMPMPFLYQMSKKGWYLKNHFTVANISHKAFFSLMSGLYDFFNRETFGLRPDACVPSLYNFLAGTHESFLVTPTSITWYFPTAFVKNSGLSEIHSYDDLKLSTKEEYHSLGHYIGRDEVETVGYFIRRINMAKEPFLGIYFSFAAHLPYFDYGPDYRIREDDGRAVSRYYNNLNLLDDMIKRIYDNLKEKGRLKRTILVFVGDHGQAFGQHHPDNLMHYRYSYNENLETPAILYQPGLFKPRAVEVPTSHVDLLPTLLDAMRIPYDPSLFDGESLFENKLQREYLFFYGYEGSISSVSTHGIKVQYSLKNKICQAFDLRLDPEEKHPLDCSPYQPQLEALHKFVDHHDSGLVQYNASLKEKKDFHGHRHPRLSVLPLQ
jgi:membrane-anchored protein YejM (alkaline phosphatase superfamily)